MTAPQQAVPNVPPCPTVPNGTTKRGSLKELAARVIQQHEEKLREAKHSSFYSYSPLSHFCTNGTNRTLGTTGTLGTEPTENARLYLMRLMTEWSERAAMMTCGDLTVAQAELAAWHDLALDRVFFTRQQLH